MLRSLVAVASLLAVFALPVQAAEHTVEMLNQGDDGTMVFSPGYLKVEPGDSVEFEAVDPAHNSASVLSPEGGTEWSGEIGKSVTVTLDTPGVYIYQCDPHLSLGMVGVIQVGEAGNVKAAKAKAKEMKSQITVNKDRIDGYLSKVE